MSFLQKYLAPLAERFRVRDVEPEPSEALDELHFERLLTDNALRTLTPAQVPDDLALRLRLAISHEQVRAERRLLGRVEHHWVSFRENNLRPIGLQIAVASIALVAVAGGVLMLGTFAPQQMVEANDEPLSGFSGPRYLYSMAGDQMVSSPSDEPIIVEAKVDTSGRVYDYRVLSGSLSGDASAALRQRMLTGVFQPAHVFGQPVRGSVVLTFADVSVRG
jgi:hypothetical protein